MCFGFIDNNMDYLLDNSITAIDALNDKFLSIQTQDMEAALAQCRAAKHAAESINYTKGILDAELNEVWYHIWKCQFSQAFPLLKELPERYTAINDNYGYLKSINCLGAIHLDMGNYDSALPYFLKSLKLSRQSKQREREASTLGNLGLLYEGLNKIEHACDYFFSALQIPEINATGFYTASRCIALYYIDKEQWYLADDYLETALQRSRQNNDVYFESELLVIKGKLNLGLKNNKAAQHCFMTGFEISKQLGNIKIETEHLYELGCLSFSEGSVDLALTYFNQVMLLAKNSEIGGLLCKSYQQLSLVYEHKKEYKLALHYLKDYNKAEKKYGLKQADLKLKSLSFEHELEKKQKLADIYRLKNIELEQANEKMLQLANHDSLTGLPNRRLLMDHLKSITSYAERNNNKIAIFFIDLDNFKPVNDQFGHRAGDTLLKLVSKRMKQQLNNNEIVCRFGGDEFVVLVPDIPNDNNIKILAHKIVDFMYESFSIEEQNYQLGSSIGISIYPDHGRDIEDLLSKADKAMYRAKIQGKNRYVIHSNN